MDETLLLQRKNLEEFIVKYPNGQVEELDSEAHRRLQEGLNERKQGETESSAEAKSQLS